jgi:hypothetical protein
MSAGLEMGIGGGCLVLRQKSYVKQGGALGRFFEICTSICTPKSRLLRKYGVVPVPLNRPSACRWCRLFGQCSSHSELDVT